MNPLNRLFSSPFFCQVLDINDNLIGITTELSADTLNLSLPRYFASETLFPVILKRHHDSTVTVRLLLSLINNQPRNEEYDDIFAKIENPEALKVFFPNFTP